MDAVFVGTIYANEQAVDKFTGSNASLVLAKLHVALDDWGSSTRGEVVDADGRTIYRCRKAYD